MNIYKFSTQNPLPLYIIVVILHPLLLKNTHARFNAWIVANNLTEIETKFNHFLIIY